MTRSILLLVLFLGLLLHVPTINAQEKQKMDSLECLKNYSLYKESLKKKMYDYSIDPWRVMFNQCPDVTIRLYSDGIDIYKHYIKLENDDARKRRFVDTIMMIYDED